VRVVLRLVLAAAVGWQAWTAVRLSRLDAGFRAGVHLQSAGAHREVEVRAMRAPPPELARLPPMCVWYLATSNLEEDAAALAEGVSRLVADPDATPTPEPTATPTQGPTTPTPVPGEPSAEDVRALIERARGELETLRATLDALEEELDNQGQAAQP
jgi:hypothetical protein